MSKKHFLFLVVLLGALIWNVSHSMTGLLNNGDDVSSTVSFVVVLMLNPLLIYLTLSDLHQLNTMIKLNKNMEALLKRIQKVREKWENEKD